MMRSAVAVAVLVTVALLCIASVHADEPMTLRLVESALATGAVCLDGTAPGYYFHKGAGSGAAKWVIHQQGGGWCYNDQACVSRSKTNLGSSSNWSKTAHAGGVLSQDADENPDFYNWNLAILNYCDGASFSGNVLKPVQVGNVTLYYRGHRILEALLNDLPGFNDSTHVLLTGCSAGGLATYLHADYVRGRAPTTASVKAMPDAGFFMDLPTWQGQPVIAQDYENVFKMSNASGGVNQLCILRTPIADRWKCFMAQYTLPHITTPIFAANSLYDSWQLTNILHLPSACEKSPLKNCTEPQYKAFQHIRDAMLGAMSHILTSKPDGMWGLSCLVHCISTATAFWNQWTVGGLKLNQVVGNWYFERSGATQVHDAAWPSNPDCPADKESMSMPSSADYDQFGSDRREYL